jgi:hypothetical protein
MTSTGPVIRARQLQLVLEHVQELPEPSRRAVQEAVGPGSVAAIEGSASSDWLPLVHELGLTHAIARVLGVEGAHRFFQKQQLESFGSPLFRSLMESATALFGLDPGSWARWIPRGWNVVFRDCGKWEIERAGAGLVHAALVAPPPACLDDEVWLRSIASSLSAFLLVACTEGEVALVRVDRERQAALYRMRWTPQAQGAAR